MTKAGERLIEGAKEALAVARREQPAAAIWIDGFKYVPADQIDHYPISDVLNRLERMARDASSATGFSALTHVVDPRFVLEVIEQTRDHIERMEAENERLRKELAEATEDCKRANELTNAAIDDYNATKANLDLAVSSRNELVEELRQQAITYQAMLAEARNKALEDAWEGYGVSLVRINDAIRNLKEQAND